VEAFTQPENYDSLDIICYALLSNHKEREFDSEKTRRRGSQIGELMSKARSCQSWQVKVQVKEWGTFDQRGCIDLK